MGWLFNLLYGLAWLAYSPCCAWRIAVRRKPIAGFWQKLTGHVDCRARSDATLPLSSRIRQNVGLSDHDPRDPRAFSTISESPRVWLHAVSVGEVNLLLQLLPRLQAQWPDRELVLSTTTQTGFELASRALGRERTFFFPFDFSWAVAHALDRIRPELIVLAELEIWPNFLRAAHRRNIPIAVVNGRLSAESFAKYRPLRWLVRSSFARLSWVGAQNREYAQRFAALGVEPSRVTVTGNMKFDGAQSNRGNPKTDQLRMLLHDSRQHIIWLAGSTQDPEERIALRCFAALRNDFPELRLILAPRHPDRCDGVSAAIRESGLKPIRRSGLAASKCFAQDEILLIDTVGELGAWWGLSQIAYVGGSMGDRGGQNMIEPAAYGCAVSFGPNTKNFRDVVTMLRASNAAIVVPDAADLENFVRRCMQEPAWRDRIGTQAQQLVLAQRGATQQTISHLSALLTSRQASINKAA